MLSKGMCPLELGCKGFEPLDLDGRGALLPITTGYFTPRNDTRRPAC